MRMAIHTCLKLNALITTAISLSVVESFASIVLIWKILRGPYQP